MPYAPGVVDRSGEIYAQGIMGAANSLSGAITSYAKNADENKTISAQNKALETLIKTGGPALGIQQSDIDALTTPTADESPRAINAKLTTVLQGAFTQRELKSRAIQDQLAQTQAAGEQQAQQQRLQQALDALAQGGRMRALFGGMPSRDQTGAMMQTGSDFSDLLPAASPPATPGDALQGSLAAGITDPRLLDAIGKYADATPWQPTLQDLGENVLSMTTSPRSAVPVQKPARTMATQPLEVAGKKFTVGPGDRYFDANGVPVQFGPVTPPKAPDIMLKDEDPELYQAQRDQYLEYVNNRKAQGATGAQTKTPAAASADPAAQAPAPGTRVKQNGVVYQFDGTKWIAVK